MQVYYYQLYDAKTHKLKCKGTAQQLVARGYFPNERALGTAYYWFQKAKKPRTIWKRELREVVEPKKPKEKPKAAKPPRKKPPLRGIADPTPLDWDVHALLLYNQKAKQQGKPELSYGQWAAKGKPERP